MLLTNATLATLIGPERYGLIENGAVAVEGERIVWVGKADEIPAEYRAQEARNLEGWLVTPSLIDCHTHIVFGGHRAREFEMRLEGASYEAIARAGGGIVSTVTSTRAANEKTLLTDALKRADALIAEGATTIEVKSGYGLDRETELRMLRVARAIGRKRKVRIKTTFLGAHAIPAEYAGRADTYIDEVVIPTMHAANAEGLVDAVVFHGKEV